MTGGGGVSVAWRARWLALLVHLDAFRLDPFGYLQALSWRARGLRVRSRNRLAALMGRSSRAYALWVARVEPEVRSELLVGARAPSQAILPIIDCEATDGSIDDTLRSIALAGGRGATPVLVRREQGSEQAKFAAELLAQVPPGGCWLCVVRNGDRLAPEALDIYAKTAARSPDSWLIYADDDVIDEGERRAPHFKCSWNPELFEHHDFITHSAIVRVTPEMVRKLPARHWAEALVRAAVARGTPLHLAAVLHHRKTRPKPLLPRKPDFLLPNAAPLVSVIVPTRNRRSLLETCVEGVRRTAYPKVELVVVDNDSDDPDTLAYLEELAREGVKILRVEGPFNFSALNNFAARHAQGKLFCFLNNDVEIVDPDWLSLLVRQAVRSDLGAIGGRLLYPDGTVQHAGVVTGVGGGAAHAHRFQRDEDAGYFFRDRLPQRVSAVTAACLLVARDKFFAVRGFNETDFPVAFNDVDLCLKLNAKGWQSFYEPRAILVHHESKSRGSDRAKENRARFAKELAALKRHWGTDRIRDPYHHPHLSPFCEQFHIAV
jgi:GT2 family glycosyltransferase